MTVSKYYAASILAKSYRDSYMIDQHNNLFFGWDKNKGYGTVCYYKY